MYKQKVEERLFGKGADAGRLRLEERLRQAHGSPSFRSTYKEYVRNHGQPQDLALLVLLLDLDDERELPSRGASSEAASRIWRCLRARTAWGMRRATWPRGSDHDPAPDLKTDGPSLAHRPAGRCLFG
jgi:hypothetical protein